MTVPGGNTHHVHPISPNVQSLPSLYMQTEMIVCCFAIASDNFSDTSTVTSRFLEFWHRKTCVMASLQLQVSPHIKIIMYFINWEIHLNVIFSLTVNFCLTFHLSVDTSVQWAQLAIIKYGQIVATFIYCWALFWKVGDLEASCAKK